MQAKALAIEALTDWVYLLHTGLPVRIFFALMVVLSLGQVSVSRGAPIVRDRLGSPGAGIERTEALHNETRRTIAEIRTGLSKIPQLRQIKGRGAIREAGYQSREAFDSALSHWAERLIDSAKAIRSRSSETEALFQEVFAALGGPRSALNRKALGAQVQSSKAQQHGEDARWVLSQLQRHKQAILSGDTLLLPTDRNALLKEIDAVALGQLVGSARYQQSLAWMKADLAKGRLALRAKSPEALPLLQRVVGTYGGLLHPEYLVPQETRRQWHYGREVVQEVPVFHFEALTSPAPPAELQRLGQELPLLVRQAAVGALRHANRLVVRGELFDSAAAIQRLSANLASLKEFQPLFQRVRGHHERRVMKATEQRLVALRAQFDPQRKQREALLGDLRQGWTDHLAQLVASATALGDPGLFGRGGALYGEVLVALEAALDGQSRRFSYLNELVIHADRAKDLYAAFLPAQAMGEEARTTLTLLLPLKLDNYRWQDVRKRLETYSQAGEAMAEARGKALNEGTAEALGRAAKAIRTGAARGGTAAAQRVSETLGARPLQPGQAQHLRRARNLMRIGGAAPERRSRALRHLISSLRREARQLDPDEALRRGLNLASRAEKIVDLAERPSLLGELGGLIAVLRAEQEQAKAERLREQRRQAKRKHQAPAKQLIALLRKVKGLAAGDEFDRALALLERAPVLPVHISHAEWLNGKSQALLSHAVRGKAAGLISQAEKLFAEGQTRAARGLAEGAAGLAGRYRVSLDGAPPKGMPHTNLPGSRSLSWRLQQLLERTAPPRLSAAVHAALIDLGLDPSDPLQATYEAAEAAYRALSKKYGFLRKGEMKGRTQREIDTATTLLVRAQLAWQKVIRRQLHPR